MLTCGEGRGHIGTSFYSAKLSRVSTTDHLFLDLEIGMVNFDGPTLYLENFYSAKLSRVSTTDHLFLDLETGKVNCNGLILYLEKFLNKSLAFSYCSYPKLTFRKFDEKLIHSNCDLYSIKQNHEK